VPSPDWRRLSLRSFRLSIRDWRRLSLDSCRLSIRIQSTIRIQSICGRRLYLHCNLPCHLCRLFI
jgi:hypothetical protein